MLMVNFCDGDIEPAFESADYAFDDVSLILERGYPRGFPPAATHRGEQGGT